MPPPPVRGPQTTPPPPPSLGPLAAGSRGVPAPPDGIAGSLPAPVRLIIPSIGVDAALGRLALDRDGSIQVPSDFDTPGWYGRGPAPGGEGAAVILGHL